MTEKFIKLFKFAYVCVYSEVPRSVRKIPQLVSAIPFQKCEMMR